MRMYSQNTLNLKWEKKKRQRKKKAKKKKCSFSTQFVKSVQKRKKKDWFSLKESFSVCLRHSHIILFTGSIIDGAACWVCNTRHSGISLTSAQFDWVCFFHTGIQRKRKHGKNLFKFSFCVQNLVIFFRFFFYWSKDPASHLSLFSTSIDAESKTKSHFIFEWGKTSQISKFCGSIFLKARIHVQFNVERKIPPDCTASGWFSK